jgi:hypothetical protein
MDPHGDAIVPVGVLTPEVKLNRNILHVCRRLIRGKAASTNWQVRMQLVLRITSIILSSLGSVGVIVDKVSTNLPGQIGWPFYGSVIVLIFGILLQVANEFQIARIATDSMLLADRCRLYETEFEDMLVFENPTQSVADLLLKIMELFKNERYNAVLPDMTSQMEIDAEYWAARLFNTNSNTWQLVAKRQTLRRTPNVKDTPTGTTAESTPSLDAKKPPSSKGDKS